MRNPNTRILAVTSLAVLLISAAEARSQTIVFGGVPTPGYRQTYAPYTYPYGGYSSPVYGVTQPTYARNYLPGTPTVYGVTQPTFPSSYIPGTTNAFSAGIGNGIRYYSSGYSGYYPGGYSTTTGAYAPYSGYNYASPGGFVPSGGVGVMRLGPVNFVAPLR